MVDAPVDITTRQRESRRGGRKAGGEPDCIWLMQFRGLSSLAGQQLSELAVDGCRIPHGVKSVSKMGKRSLTEPRNFIAASDPVGKWMAEAIGDRSEEGRSLRSSLRTGKPFTWRREAVNRDRQQEEGICLMR